MTLSAEQRRAEILKELQLRGRVRVADLSRQFEISEVSIRNDLEILELQAPGKKKMKAVDYLNGHEFDSQAKFS